MNLTQYTLAPTARLALSVYSSFPNNVCQCLKEFICRANSDSSRLLLSAYMKPWTGRLGKCGGGVGWCGGFQKKKLNSALSAIQQTAPQKITLRYHCLEKCWFYSRLFTSLLILNLSRWRPNVNSSSHSKTKERVFQHWPCVPF